MDVLVGDVGEVVWDVGEVVGVVIGLLYGVDLNCFVVEECVVLLGGVDGVVED